MLAPMQGALFSYFVIIISFTQWYIKGYNDMFETSLLYLFPQSLLEIHLNWLDSHFRDGQSRLFTVVTRRSFHLGNLDEASTGNLDKAFNWAISTLQCCYSTKLSSQENGKTIRQLQWTSPPKVEVAWLHPYLFNGQEDLFLTGMNNSETMRRGRHGRGRG